MRETLKVMRTHSNKPVLTTCTMYVVMEVP